MSERSSAGNDFGLYQVAKGLGKTQDAAKYLDRSRNWRNQWNPDLETMGFKGFLGPIAENGSFIDQNPLSCGGCYWADEYVRPRFSLLSHNRFYAPSLLS